MDGRALVITFILILILCSRSVALGPLATGNRQFTSRRSFSKYLSRCCLWSCCCSCCCCCRLCPRLPSRAFQLAAVRFWPRPNCWPKFMRALYVTGRSSSSDFTSTWSTFVWLLNGPLPLACGPAGVAAASRKALWMSSNGCTIQKTHGTSLEWHSCLPCLALKLGGFTRNCTFRESIELLHLVSDRLILM